MQIRIRNILGVVIGACIFALTAQSGAAFAATADPQPTGSAYLASSASNTVVADNANTMAGNGVGGFRSARALPEPSDIGMLLAGFALLGAGVAFRRRVSSR